jgi:CheY-like chemotaxis protein
VASAVILCVDDEEIPRTLRVMVLIKQGYTVLAAVSAVQALELLDRHHVDLVLTDQMMPDIVGTELAKSCEQAARGCRSSSSPVSMRFRRMRSSQTASSARWKARKPSSGTSPRFSPTTVSSTNRMVSPVETGWLRRWHLPLAPGWEIHSTLPQTRRSHSKAAPP